MIEVNAYKLENGLIYNEVCKTIYGECIYVLLVNENNTEDMCIRKLMKKNNDDDVYLSMLDKDEYNIILKKFTEENKDLVG